jgi:hypothetical protein
MCQSEKKHVSRVAPVGIGWPNSTRAVVFGQGRAFDWKDFCNLSFLPGRGPEV